MRFPNVEYIMNSVDLLSYRCSNSIALENLLQPQFIALKKKRCQNVFEIVFFSKSSEKHD